MQTHLERFRALGTDLVVSLLTDQDLADKGLEGLAQAVESAGFELLRFPIPDFGLPADLDAAVRFVDDLLDRMHKGKKVVMHCSAGLGRSGTMDACLRLPAGFVDGGQLTTDVGEQVTPGRHNGGREPGADEGNASAFEDFMLKMLGYFDFDHWKSPP